MLRITSSAFKKSLGAALKGCPGVARKVRVWPGRGGVQELAARGQVRKKVLRMTSSGFKKSLGAALTGCQGVARKVRMWPRCGGFRSWSSLGRDRVLRRTKSGPRKYLGAALKGCGRRRLGLRTRHTLEPLAWHWSHFSLQ